MKVVTFFVCILLSSAIFAMQEDCPHWCAPEDNALVDIEELPACTKTVKKTWSVWSVDESKKINQQIQHIRDEIESATIYEVASLNVQLKRLQARQRQLLEE